MIYRVYESVVFSHRLVRLETDMTSSRHDVIEHERIGRNTHEKVKNFKYLGPLVTSKLYSGGNKM